MIEQEKCTPLECVNLPSSAFMIFYFLLKFLLSYPSCTELLWQMLTLKAGSVQENVQCVHSTKTLRICTYLGTSVFLTCIFYFCLHHVVLYSLTSAAVL